MAIAVKGLRSRPKYEQLIGVADSCELNNTKFPNRDAPCLRKGFVLPQLDGEGMRAMELQQQRHIKEVYTDSALIISKGPWQRTYFDFFIQECTHTIYTNTEN